MRLPQRSCAPAYKRAEACEFTCVPGFIYVPNCPPKMRKGYVDANPIGGGPRGGQTAAVTSFPTRPPSAAPLRDTLMNKPSCVWMVAPVVILISFGSSARSKLNRLTSIANATAASSTANWSPTHLREPPPNGKYAKSVDVCMHEQRFRTLHLPCTLLVSTPTQQQKHNTGQNKHK